MLPPVLAAGCVTVPQLRRRVRRAVLALDPSTAEERHQRAAAERRVEYHPGEDGTAALTAILPAPEAQSIYTRLTTAAKLFPSEDTRTLDQKRADLLIDAMLSGLPLGALPQPQGRRRPVINVLVNADTLLGLDDQPGHLTGYGPITAHTARRLAADQSGTWRRLLTDPDTGALLDISQHRYRPPQRLRDYANARDDACALPTCRQPGRRCEPDHTIAFNQGGTTTRDNLALTCRRHNQAKAGTGWTYQHNPNDSYTWTTNTGHHYTSPANRPWTQPGDTTSPGRPPDKARVKSQPTEDEDPPPF